jgi:hypothetical protein
VKDANPYEAEELRSKYLQVCRMDRLARPQDAAEYH